MTLSAYLTVIVANLIGAISPGPDTILVTRMATRSRRHAVAASTGIQVGLWFWVSLTVFGAAAFLMRFPHTLSWVQIIGGLWLLRMGVLMARGGWMMRKYPPTDLEELEAQSGTLTEAFTKGLTTNLSNPKAVLFFSALIAPMLPADPSLGTALALIAGLCLSAYVLFLVISVTVSTDRVRRRLLRATPWIDVAAGTFFMCAGAALIVAGVMSL